MVNHTRTHTARLLLHILSLQCYDRIIAHGSRHSKLVDIMWPDRENKIRVLQL